MFFPIFFQSLDVPRPTSYLPFPILEGDFCYPIFLGMDWIRMDWNGVELDGISSFEVLVVSDVFEAVSFLGV